ncbi:ATP-binding protein [Streptomyces sp. NPDC006798]|uniref:ATP-binding protein n=1 Tax=Streptomyces sp. NPDC006798 TaxID=3155462 RepID=UPI0033CFD8B1
MSEFPSDCWLDLHGVAERQIRKKKFPGREEEVSRARIWAKGRLKGESFSDDAALIVAELSANAIRHTVSGGILGRFTLEYAVSERVVTLSVVDEGRMGNIPHRKVFDGEAEGGWGLGIVVDLPYRAVKHRSSAGFRIAVDFLRVSDPPEPE